jgi:hypothetical protein
MWIVPTLGKADGVGAVMHAPKTKARRAGARLRLFIA